MRRERDRRVQGIDRQGRDRRDAEPRGGRARLRHHDVGRSDALADGRPADGAAGARRDRRRDHRRGHARCATRCCGSRRRPTPSTWSAPAATPRARSTSRPAPPSSWPAPACRWPSTATARCRRAPGAADVLGALGVNIELTPEGVSRCIKQAGIGFMFAPAHHPAMKNVGPTRVELGTRTIFNLLGPLSNPAGVKRQMVGVFSRQWLEPLAQVLKNLGSESRLGRARLGRARRDHDRRDDLRRRAGERRRAHLRDHARGRGSGAGQARGAARRRAPSTTRRRCVDVLKGKTGPFRDVAVLNAAAGADGRRSRARISSRRLRSHRKRSIQAKPTAGCNA